MRIPDFFIVGAPKSGTTALYTYLRQHPEIFMPERKESHFFGTDLHSPLFIREKEQYLLLFSGAGDEKRIGESSVWYLYSKKAASEIREFSPCADIIIMLRNPVDMLYSQHSQFLYNGNEDIACFEEALDAEEDRKHGLRVPPGVHFVESLFYRKTVKYTEQVRRYFDIFGREHVHIIIYDDFEGNVSGAYRECLRFLGVTEDFRPEFKIINSNKRVRSNALRNFLQNPPRIVKSFGRLFVSHSRHQKLLKDLTSFNKKYESRPPMDAGLRRKLQAEFAPEVERLSGLLKRDLSHWCKT